jgi:hypothetical protein
MAITKRGRNIIKDVQKNYILKAKEVIILAEKITLEAGNGEIILNSNAKINIKGNGGS